MTNLTASMQFGAVLQASVDIKQLISVVPGREGVEDRVPPDGVVPADLVRFLARLRLLEGVPFDYLVADTKLLPPETIRFFYLDRNFTDALVQGALSVGTVNSADHVQLEQLYGVIRNEVDQAERLVRMKDADAPKVDAQGRPIGQGGAITGFVLRSRIVSGWPGLHVRAYATDTHPDDATIPDIDTSPDRVRLLRMERLAPAVLLVLFDGVPAVVHIEEPRSGIQFGVRLDSDADPRQQTAVLGVRDVKVPKAQPLQTPAGKDRTVKVPFRAGSPGVINMKQLDKSLVGVSQSNMGTTIEDVDSAEFAIEMLRFPLRQVFGDTSVANTADSFVANIGMATLVTRFDLARQVLER